MHNQFPRGVTHEATPADPTAFMAKFERYWAAPTAADMATLLTEDVLLVQPLSPSTRGLCAAQARFATVFRWVPDMRGRVDEWCARGAHLYIAFRLSGSMGGAYVEWPAIDRIVLRGDFACERVSYFDPVPIMRTLALRPAAWITALRSGLWRGMLTSGAGAQPSSLIRAP